MNSLLWQLNCHDDLITMTVIDYESMTMHIKHLNCHLQNIESVTRCTIFIRITAELKINSGF